MRAGRGIGTVRGSYPQARPPGNERVTPHAIDDDQLLPACRTRDDPDVAPADPEGIGEALEQRRVGGAFHRRRGHSDPEHAVEDALDSSRGRSGREPHGESDVGGTQDLRTRA